MSKTILKLLEIVFCVIAMVIDKLKIALNLSK